MTTANDDRRWVVPAAKTLLNSGIKPYLTADVSDSPKCPKCSENAQSEDIRLELGERGMYRIVRMELFHCDPCAMVFWVATERRAHTYPIDNIWRGDTVCPECKSENWACFDEQYRWFSDDEGNFQFPVGRLKCKDCGRFWEHTDIDDKYIGE